MLSLYDRARRLGVVSPSFEGLTALDLSAVTELFRSGYDQNTILNMMGIDSVTVPVKSLTPPDYDNIRKYVNWTDSAQTELFDDED